MIRSCFFDSSALIKRYNTDEGSDIVKYIFEMGPDNRIYTSSIAIGEVFNRLKSLEEENSERAIWSFESHLARGKIKVLTPETYNSYEMSSLLQNVRILEVKYKVDPTDAFHFLIMEKEFNKLDNLHYLCADEKLCKLVKDQGYKVINPTENLK